MVFIKTENDKVTYMHYMPFDKIYGLGKTKAELLRDGYLVDAIPNYEGEVPDDKTAELHYNGTEFSYVLVDKPKSQGDAMKEKLASLEAQQEATNEAILGLMNMLNLGA
jgi:hypothetical protein|nr:MAG TPA: hypothetical protein [Caudoviricetes sp.]